MKRLACMLAVSLLMFCGCTRMAAVRTDEPAETKEPEVQTVKSAFYIKGELPDIGSFSGSEKYKRFYEEYTPYFIPSDKYGEIIPFIGKSKIYETPKYEKSSFSASSMYSSYGFCTKDGRVVMDANPDIQHISYRETDDGFGCYQYSVLSVNKDDPYEFEVYGPHSSFLVPKSGKWCIELPQGAWVNGIENGYIVIAWPSEEEQEEYPVIDRIRIYNYDGELVSQIEDDGGGDEYSCGMIVVRDYSGDRDVSEFVNLKGERVWGPFSWASSFNDYGVAIVKNYDDEYYLMDDEGNRITTQKYSNISEVYGFTDVTGFQAVHADNRRNSDVYSLDGKLLGTIESESTYYNIDICDDETVIYSYNKGETECYKYMDGTPFVSSELGVSPNQYVSGDDVYVYRDDNTKKAVVFNHKGETLFKLDELEYLGYVNKDNSFAVYTTGSAGYEFNEITGESFEVDTVKQHIYDIKNQKIVLTSDGNGHSQFAGKDDRYIIIQVTQSSGMFSSVYKYSLYDTQTGKMLFRDCLNITDRTIGGEDYFNVCTKNKSTLYDGEFNVVLKTLNE